MSKIENPKILLGKNIIKYNKYSKELKEVSNKIDLIIIYNIYYN